MYSFYYISTMNHPKSSWYFSWQCNSCSFCIWHFTLYFPAPHLSIESLRTLFALFPTDIARVGSRYEKKECVKMAFTFAAFAYVIALIFSAFLIFFAIWHIIAFDELKTDYKNPIDQVWRTSKWRPFFAAHLRTAIYRGNRSITRGGRNHWQRPTAVPKAST